MHFPTWWEHDLDAIVAKDFNHPSVIFYSIGNEIEEVGLPAGAELARAMAARIRAQDATRLITNGVNLTLTVLADASDGLLNATLGGSGAADLAQSDLVTRKTEESFAVLDVAGYNYAESRYVADHDRFPNRVIVGTETFPRQIDRLWRLVLDNDHVIGDFTWTGWDYLGEVGIGRTEYESDPPVVGDGFVAPYPWRTAACADIDITGHRLPISFYRQIVFGLRVEPFIAVRPPAHHMANKRFSTPWSWSTSVDSWTWDGDEGRPTLVEVYADADEVELMQDGRSLGRQPAGEAHRFSARFEVTYEPGELVAVAHRGGVEVGRTTLRSAVGALRLRLEVDQEEAAHGVADLAFVKANLVDDAGTPHPGADRELRVRVEGPAVLQGLGSAAPASEDDYLADHCRTYRGRALAVVRPTGVGAITVHVDSDGIQPATATIVARSAMEEL